MFQGIREQQSVFIFDKNDCSLQVAQVKSVSNPVNQFGQPPMFGQVQGVTVDVTVVAENGDMEFKKLPVQASVASVDNLVISDSREAMLQEVEGMLKMSEQVLENVPKHKQIVEACRKVIPQLNPSAAQEQRMNALEGEVQDMKGMMNDIRLMLSEALKPKTS